jgi:predicted glutamine amidotransferase
MCGLVGLAGDIHGDWKKVFLELLLFDVVRGPHSTGAGFVNKKDESFNLVKRVGHPFNLFHEDSFEKLIDKPHEHKVIMGHNRSATIGDKSESNAHPFMFPHVLGVHNGTLDKFCIKDLTNNALYGTDSQAIFATIEEKGIDETIKLLSGAWALIWFDRRDHTLNMLNNGKRPLHYCYNKDRTVLAWASEATMLEYVLARHNKAIEKDEKGENVIFSPPTDQLHTWIIPEKINTKIEVPVRRKIEGRAWVSSVNFHLGTKKHGKHHGGTTAAHYTAPIRTFWYEPVEFAHRPKSRKFRQPYKDRYGRVIVKSEFDAMVSEGCMFCGSNGQKWNEFIWVAGAYHGYHTPYVCEDCYNSEEQYNIAQFAI